MCSTAPVRPEPTQGALAVIGIAPLSLDRACLRWLRRDCRPGRAFPLELCLQSVLSTTAGLSLSAAHTPQLPRAIGHADHALGARTPPQAMCSPTGLALELRLGSRPGIGRFFNAPSARRCYNTPVLPTFTYVFVRSQRRKITIPSPANASRGSLGHAPAPGRGFLANRSRPVRSAPVYHITGRLD